MMDTGHVLTLAPRENIYTDAAQCHSPDYLWWSCSFGGQFYTGCCNVDACHETPAGCPPVHQQPTSPSKSTPASTIARTITTQPPSSTVKISITSSTSSLVPSTPSTPVSPGPTSSSGTAVSITTRAPTAAASPITAAATDANSSQHVTLPIGTLVGIVIGCCIVAAAAAFLTYKCWTRRQGKKGHERPATTGDFLSSESDHLPSPTLPTTAMARRRFITSFDEAAGPMPDTRTMGMSSPLEYKQQASAASPSSMGFSETSAMVSELDSTPINDARWSAGTTLEDKTAGMRSPTASQGPTESLRGTLSSTRGDRESGTYVNSWSRFQNIQV
ncbi:hypothetical protein B0T22DRAFT_97021 [Podospora appendiculata]|uniref:Uncharacterized protein n=1 Tax=Podospora appendiculata TaxID=314037 RepID=A0AAE0XKY7_9PEZI|nr:hypothetical protein B0T22DRAFT_97021 [Podospora appendiculata]